jgi:hypothetical protein
MNRNFVGNIYGRSSIKIANFVPIRLNKHGCHAIGNSCFWLVDF